MAKRSARGGWCLTASLAGLGLLLALGAVAFFALKKQSPGEGPLAQTASQVATAADPNRAMWALYTIGSDFEDDVDGDDEPDEAAAQGGGASEGDGAGEPEHDGGGDANGGHEVEGQGGKKKGPKAAQGEGTQGSARGCDNHGASSADLIEVAEALKAMPAEQRGRLKVLVAFGGARKAGWQGYRTLDAEGLIRDAEDRCFGNLPKEAYGVLDPKANMADPATFQRFFQQVKQEAQGATVVVELGGHGMSYGGMGADMNQDEEARWVSLPQIGHALQASGLKGGVLAFTACLMSSAEVAKAVGTNFTYMVGSEESLALTGWNYRTTLGMLGQSPPQSLEAIAKAYADSIVDDPAHAEEEGKTGSVIDLAKAQAIAPALDAWAAAMDPNDEELRGLVVAASRTCHGFGQDEEGDDPTSVDALDFFKAMAKRSPRLRPQCEAVVAAAKAAVLHSRADEHRPFAKGISIYPPHLRVPEGEEAWYGPETSASDGYWKVIDGLRAHLAEVKENPAKAHRK